MSHARFAPDWLALREGADAFARATDLLGPLWAHLPAGPLVIRDLGCGTGSMGRWLAVRLRGPQHWILHDSDPELLARAVATMPAGDRVTAEARQGDLTRLRAADLAGSSLVTASALLDLLTFDEVDALVAAIALAGCPALLTLSVTGRVELAPADPLDAAIADAFNAHQRRSSLLGPDAAHAATKAFERRGVVVLSRPSPWRLGPDQAALTGAWLRGRVAAAVEQRPELTPLADGYLRRRLDACAQGSLRAVVQHSDLLAY